MLRVITVTLGLTILLLISINSSAENIHGRLETITDDVVSGYMAEKRIQGLSVTIVHQANTVFSKAYGNAHLSPDIPARADSIYPISSVSRIFAGLVSLKLDEKNLIALDDPISAYLEGLPEDKQAITIRQLLTHTHGLTDFYHSADFEKDTGIHSDNASAEALTAWSLNQPLAAQPGSVWTYNVVGYAVLGMVLQSATGLSFSDLAQREVFDPLHMVAYYGNSDTVIDGQSPTLYELVDDKVVTHPVEFRPFVYPAAGLNISVAEMAKLFAALSGDRFLSTQQKTELWRAMELPDGKSSFYGLGWFSYTTSQNRWVVGHEGGGASWIIYYPDQQLSVIALSNMSGARADMLPFDIARAAFDAALFE